VCGRFKVGAATLLGGNLVRVGGGVYVSVLLRCWEGRAMVRRVGVLGMRDMVIKETFEIVKGTVFRMGRWGFWR
jgi:hypothetical protein